MQKKIYIEGKNGFKDITIRKGNKMGAGIECFYIAINKSRGIKIFPEKSNANNSLRRQKKAYRYRLAPQPLSEKTFQVLIPMGFDELIRDQFLKRDLQHFFNNQIGYAYFTQIAKTLKSDAGYTSSEHDILQTQLYKIFPKDDLNDLHYGNLGRIGKKLVCIDFGDESSL